MISFLIESTIKSIYLLNIVVFRIDSDTCYFDARFYTFLDY